MMNPLTFSLVIQHQEQMRRDARRARLTSRAGRSRRSARSVAPVIYLRHGPAADVVVGEQRRAS